MKLPRAVLAMWLSFDKKEWTLIGKDTEELAFELNPDVNTKQNVLGDNVVDHSGYKPELNVDKYYARTEDSIYKPIKDIAMNRKSDDESIRAYLAEAILTDEVCKSDTVTLTGDAWIEDAVVVPQSYGHDLAGLGIPFIVYPNGGRKEHAVSVTERVPTFTEKTGAGEDAEVRTASQPVKQTAGAGSSTTK